ncbi:hypothetical protein AVEN_75607-1 [Araneus ventricosus]|uniref:Uncharacterized protein n=1 Tax=Araneus ventricosus TaxID=182803 RepID=A0A4Y2CMX7_ARAVE|nr:hypothetical protein AVEN_75607-1 [Araneus ventricosus]
MRNRHPIHQMDPSGRENNNFNQSNGTNPTIRFTVFQSKGAVISDLARWNASAVGIPTNGRPWWVSSIIRGAAFVSEKRSIPSLLEHPIVLLRQV